MVDVTLVGGSPVTDDHREIDPATGMQKAYVVLSEDEIAKGFVRPVRLSYIHVGKPLPTKLRDLTDEEKQRYPDFNYVKFEEYDPADLPILGQFWTQEDLDGISKGCDSITTMNLEIAESYAAQPAFYSGTFCSQCRGHFPVGKSGEFIWADGSGQRVGT